MNFIKNFFKGRKEHLDITNAIIKDWEENPMDWNIDRYTASKGSTHIWISNSPYADMTIHGMRLPNRGLLRKKLLELSLRQVKERLNNK